MSVHAPRIALVSAGMGNIRSVANAFAAVGAPAEIVSDAGRLESATHVVLPGVGAFGDGMENLRKGGWIGALEREVLGRGKPFLGICLGMQLLAQTGTEHGRHDGLGWIPGNVERLEAAERASLRVPHIGWNTVRFAKSEGPFAACGQAQDFYFVHSYALVPSDGSVTAGTTNYGQPFVAAISWKNVHAVQFHPEKSQRAGLALLRAFAGLRQDVHA